MVENKLYIFKNLTTYTHISGRHGMAYDRLIVSKYIFCLNNLPDIFLI